MKILVETELILMVFNLYASPFNYPYNRLEQFHYSFIRDLIESGYLEYNLLCEEVYNRRNLNYINDIIKNKLLTTNENYLSTYISSRIGYCFESFVSFYLSIDDSVRLEMLKKCFRNPNKTSAYNEKITCVNLGSYSTELYKPEIYDTHNPHFDTIFAKINKQGINQITNCKSDFKTVGFQIKAIKSSLVTKIINPIYQKKYPIVLTLLECENEYGDIIHTKAQCITKINSSEKKFNKKERQYVMDSIVSPEEIGIPQNIINEYYNYMYKAFKNEYDFSLYILKGIWLYNDYLIKLGNDIFNKVSLIQQMQLPIITPNNEVEILVEAG
ncbi:hypothetical protein [Clostridium sp.]|uniref:hypothetical protein n=1 Tax=Clostridium sp. TaxID=1506 RepID=UPI00283E35AB|nr:hypothetical protein [Clostridium sp.]MDR3594918.1 hypothetical protein [Clostridium sp.]